MKTFRFSKIKELRESAKLSQTELAQKIGIPPQQLWGWENSSDDKSLTTAYLAKIASALGVSTDDFFEENKA
jgi:transcriptional regulator with XRE-family HTH domain